MIINQDDKLKIRSVYLWEIGIFMISPLISCFSIASAKLNYEMNMVLTWYYTTANSKLSKKDMSYSTKFSDKMSFKSPVNWFPIFFSF